MSEHHTPAGHARELYEAERSVQRTGKLSERGPELTTERAYAVQREVDKLRLAAGGRIIGRKIGLASRELQARGNAREPFWAHVFADRAVESPATLDSSRYHFLRVEPEIAVVLGTDLAGPAVTIAQLRPALEVVDVRTDVAGLHVNESIADSGWNAGCVLGAPLPATGIDLDTVSVSVRSGHAGGVIAHGNASILMDGPAGCLAWLANHVAAAGYPLRAGEIILTGTMAGAPVLTPGNTLIATYNGLSDEPAEVVVTTT